MSLDQWHDSCHILLLNELGWEVIVVGHSGLSGSVDIIRKGREGATVLLLWDAEVYPR